MNTNSIQLENQEPAADLIAIREGLDLIGFPIALTGIRPDGKQPGDNSAAPTKWFGVGEEHAAVKWAAHMNASGFGVYWTPNITRPSINKKPQKVDIVAARFAHADMDPPKNAGAWTVAERDEYLEALEGELLCAPSFVISSGAGLHAYWRLDGECQNCQSIEAINRGIRDAVGADEGTWNIDRLLRVPGTWNYPKAAKRKNGRQTTLCEIVRHDTGERYEAHRLAAAFPEQAGKRESEAASPVVVNFAGYEPLTLEAMGITDFALLRAVHEPRGIDRSDDVLHAAFEMVRCGFLDNQIINILLNPENPVSAHCLDQSNSVRAAQRAIAKARRVEEIAEGEVEHICDRPRVVIDFERFVANGVAKQKARAVEAANDAGIGIVRSSMPDISLPGFDLQTEPGLLGDIARWSVASAYRPVEGFAIPAALATLAATFGRRIITPTGLGVNLFIVGVGGTGVGKDALLEAPRKLLSAANLQKRIGPGDFASDSAIEKSLRHRPCQLMPLDEFGKLVQVLMGERSAAHSHLAVKVLLSLYSRSQPNSEWTGKARAGDDFDVADAPIHSPTLTLLGASTPEGFFKGMNPATLEDGFTNRLTLFNVGNVIPPRNRGERPEAPPACLVDALRAAYDATIPTGNLAAGAFDNASAKPTFIRAKWADEAARDALIAIEDWQDVAVFEEGRNWSANRAGEQTLKIATLRAASRNPAAPTITAEDMGWAFAIVWNSIEGLETGAREMMAGSVFESAVNVVRLAIFAKGRAGILRSKLLVAKGVSALDNRLVDQAIARLQDIGDIVIQGKNYKGTHLD